MTPSKVQNHRTKDLMVLPFSYQDIEVLALNIREEQEVTLKQISYMGAELHEYGYGLVSKAAINRDGNKIAFSGISEDTVEACSGIVEIGDGVYEAWAFFSKTFKKYGLCIARAIKSEVDNLDFVRLQAYADSDFKDARRFLEFLGFKRETELRNYYGKGKHAILYSIVRED